MSGKVYGIVGSSGSGKSTFLSMLIKSNRDYEGTIFVNDHELRPISSDSLYHTFSLIQQEVFIFDTTIENNIIMFKNFPEEKAKRVIELSGLPTLLDEKEGIITLVRMETDYLVASDIE